jgi:hypothetical protein
MKILPISGRYAWSWAPAAYCATFCVFLLIFLIEHEQTSLKFFSFPWFQYIIFFNLAARSAREIRVIFSGKFLLLKIPPVTWQQATKTPVFYLFLSFFELCL